MTKKRYLINFTVILILSVFSGFFLGNYYSKNFGRNVEAVTISEETVRGKDVTNALKKASGKNPSQLTATENFVLAEYYLNQKTSVKRVVTGTITAAGINQSLFSEKIVHNGQVYSSKISASSMVKVAEVYKHNLGTDVIDVYKGSVTSATTADFPTAPSSSMNMEQYKASFGSVPERFVTYVVGTKTVINESAVTKNQAGNYVATLQLDTTYAVMNYVYEIKTTAGSSKLPYFKSVKITYEIDENWNLIKINTEESYDVSIAVLGYTGCTGQLQEVYTYTDVTMPN